MAVQKSKTGTGVKTEQPPPPPLRRGYGHMVIDDYVAQVREIRAERRARLAAIRSRRAAEKYQEGVLAAIHNAFSPLPRKTPLNARVTGVLERPGYRVEKVIFESRPGFLVTANLYMPEKVTRPVPGVIGACGHSAIGKAEPRYQEFCHRLIKAGFAALIYDPVNQGERDQYAQVLPPEHPVRKGCCTAHNMMGKQMELVADSFSAWRAWDGIRALDYLLSRPEVDPARIGITGNSGGGTMTTWLWGVEGRFAMAAPSCFVTTFLANLENEEPADSEQYPPGVVGAGLEHIDFMLARAPKPILLLGQKYDFFDPRGLREAHGELRQFYGHFGAEQNAALFIGNNPHGYHPDNQQAMATFFCKQARQARPKGEVAFEAAKTEEVLCTPKGEVVLAGSRPIFEITAETAERYASARRPLSRADLGRRLARLLRVSQPVGVPHFRVLQPTWGDGAVRSRYAVETERDIRAIVRKHVVVREHADSFEIEPAVSVFLPHFSAEADLRSDSLAKALTARGPLYAVDVRGLGESQPDEPGEFFAPYGADYMCHGHGILLDKSYLGRRVFDVLSVLALLKDAGVRDITLYGRGQGGVLALFAAVLAPDVKKVVLKNGPVSYLDWMRAPDVHWPAANCLRGALKEFDLPDCIRALGRKVALVEPWGPDMQPLAGPALRAALKRAGLPTGLVVPQRRVEG